MTITFIRDFCLSQNGTRESLKWGDHLCFSVANKMYLIINPDGVPVTCSFKTTPELFDELTAREGIIPAPYLARHMWVQVDDIKRLSNKEGVQLFTIAYQEVFEKLPARQKKELLAGK